ncbi:MAG: alpha/beta fold hydrolase [Candidatus Binatia bacterium]
MQRQRVTLNGLSFQVYTWGKPAKPKLFLIHGWLDSGAGYDFVCRALERDFFCIAPDLRGYGRTGHGQNPLGYFFFEHLADLHALFRRFSPREAVRVLGHSLGGALIGIYAGAFPERVSHFINVEGFAFRDNPPGRGPQKLRQWIEARPAKPFKTYPTRRAFARQYRKIHPRLTEERAAYLAEVLTKKVPRGYCLRADPLQRLADPAVFTREMILAFWREIRARCLLVSAAETNINDWIQVPDLEKELEERFRHFPPGSPRVVIPDCGHMVHYDQPEQLAEHCRRFLRPTK